MAGVAAAARLPLTDEAPVVVLPVVRLPLSRELLLEPEVVSLPLLVVVVVVLASLELLELLLELEVEVMTIVPVPEDEVVVVADARPELYSAHSLDPTEAATPRSEAAQAPIRQGAAKEPIALETAISWGTCTLTDARSKGLTPE